jgi:hypothetical protein
MNTAKNAYDKILNGIGMYQRELQKLSNELDSEYLKNDLDMETIDCIVEEKNRTRAIIFGLQLGLSLTYNEAFKGQEVTHEPV